MRFLAETSLLRLLAISRWPLAEVAEAKAQAKASQSQGQGQGVLQHVTWINICLMRTLLASLIFMMLPLRDSVALIIPLQKRHFPTEIAEKQITKRLV